MKIPTWLAIAAVLAACGTPERAPSGTATGSGTAATDPVAGSAQASAKPPQTARDAMQLVCDAHAASGASTAAPAERAQLVSHWLGERVTNAEVRAVVDSLAAQSERDARLAVLGAAKRFGVETCMWPDATLPVAVPETHSGTEPDTEPGPLVIVSRTELVYEGTPVLALQDGAIDPRQLEKLGDRIKANPPSGRVRVAFDSTLPVKTAALVVESLARGGANDIAMLALQGGNLAVLPLHTRGDDKPEVMVGVTADQILVWSRSGKHGTRAKPLVSAPVDAGLGDLVRGLAIIRTAHRDALPRVAVMFDERYDVAQIARIIGAIRPALPSVTLQRGVP